MSDNQKHNKVTVLGSKMWLVLNLENQSRLCQLWDVWRNEREGTGLQGNALTAQGKVLEFDTTHTQFPWIPSK